MNVRWDLQVSEPQSGWVSRNQMFVTSMEEMVSADSCARIVDLFMDSMPLEDFGFTHMELNKEGNIPYHPGDIFKLLLYGYRKRIRSVLKLAEACTINVEVMWLLKGLKPSARTINYFRSDNGSSTGKAHRHFVQLLKKWRMIKGETLAVDSMKIRGQNSLKIVKRSMPKAWERSCGPLSADNREQRMGSNQRKIGRHREYIDGKITDYLDQLGKIESKHKKTKKDREELKSLEEKISQKESRKEDYKSMEDKVKASSVVRCLRLIRMHVQ